VQFGTVLDISIPKFLNGKSKGYRVVEFDKKGEAEKA
jgi:RNA recognition motif-containing protein